MTTLSPKSPTLLQGLAGAAPGSLSRFAWTHALLPLCAAAVALIAFETTRIDYTVSGWFFEAATGRFPLRYSTGLEIIMHQWAKYVVVLIAGGAVVTWLFSFTNESLRELRRPLLFLSLSLMAAPVIVTFVKSGGAMYCPYEVVEYGGSATRPGLFEGGGASTAPGQCLLSGHASAGFGLMAFYFAGLAIGNRRLAWVGLVGGAAAGLIFGMARVAQGAHFLSQVVWAGFISWYVVLAISLALCWRTLIAQPSAIGTAEWAGGSRAGTAPDQRASAGRSHGAVVAAALVTLCAALWFGQLQSRALFEPDEGRYAEIPREMVATGDWITPRLNGLLYFEKPPLQYWATATAYTVFGPHNWTARLWSALTGLAGILLSIYAASRLFSPRAGWYTGLVLTSTLLYFGAAQTNSLDMGLTFFLGLTVCSLALGLRAEASGAGRRLWIHVAWLAAALAALTKGLVGIVLPAGALAAYWMVWPDRTIWKKLRFTTGLPLFLLVAAPWFVAMSIADPDFARFFFIHEHFERFLTNGHDRYQPWWFFAAVLCLGALPWTFPAVAGVWRAIGRRGPAPFRPDAFLATWILVVLVFFSASTSKLAGYIVPVVPAVAILCGRYLSESAPRTLAIQFLSTAVIALIGVALAASLTGVAHRNYPHELVEAKAMWLTAAAVIWLASAVAATIASRGGRILHAIMCLAIGALVTYQMVLTGFNVLAPQKSSQALASLVKPYVEPGTPVYTVGMYPQSLPFYLGRTVTVVNYRGELGFGLDREPGKGIRDLPDFVARWNAEPGAVAVMHAPTRQSLAAAGVPMSVIAESGGIVAVRRP